MSTSYVCSAASARRDEPMFATGSLVRGWLLVEVRGAWGEDAIHTSAFGEYVPRHWKDDLKRRQIRAVCVRSHARAEAPPTFDCSHALPDAPARDPRRCGVAMSPRWPTSSPRPRNSPSTSRPPSGWERVERAADPRVHQRTPRSVLCEPRPTARPRTPRLDVGRPPVGVLAHRRRPIRRQPRDTAGQPLLRSGRPGVGPWRAWRSGRGADRPLPVPWAHVVLACRAGGRALRAARARASMPSTAWSSIGGPTTARSRCGSPTAWCTYACSVGLVSVVEPLTCKGRADQLVPTFTLESITDG